MFFSLPSYVFNLSIRFLTTDGLSLGLRFLSTTAYWRPSSRVTTVGDGDELLVDSVVVVEKKETDRPDEPACFSRDSTIFTLTNDLFTAICSDTQRLVVVDNKTFMFLSLEVLMGGLDTNQYGIGNLELNACA